MGRHRARSKERFAPGVLLGVVASGLAATAVGGAGTANASCASISGIGNSADCTSTPGSFAVGLGTGAKATSVGFFDGAVSNGNNAQSIAGGTGSFAYAGGDNSIALAGGLFSIAATQGTNNLAVSNGVLNGAFNFGNGTAFGKSQTISNGVGNLTVNSGTDSLVGASGLGNGAFNVVGNNNFLQSSGVLNNTLNVAGNNNILEALGGTFDPANPLATTVGGNTAFNAFGNKNAIGAGLPGPFAIAGAVGQSDQNGANAIVRQTPGFNINHNAFP
jgi:hypothetical protein